MPRATQHTEPDPQIYTRQVTPSLVLSDLVCPVGRGLLMSLPHHTTSWPQTMAPLVPTNYPLQLLLSPGPWNLLISGTGPTLPGATRWLRLQGLLGPDTGFSGPWPLSVGLEALGRHVAPCRRGNSERGCPSPEQMRYKTGTFFSNF